MKVTLHDRRDWLKSRLFVLDVRGIQTVEPIIQSIKIGLFSPRSEPSSRAFLIGEQPNPWDLLQPQDKTSRHRGAELRRRYELLGGTSLLSLE